MDIDIFSVIGKNGKMCAEFLRNNMRKFKSKDNGTNFKAMMSSQDPPKKWEVQEFMCKLEHTSLNHTTAVNRIKHYVTSEYLIVCDIDVAVLCNDWDKKLIQHMEETKSDILGIDHWSDTNTYAGFPIITFFIVRKKVFLRAECDFRPNFQPYPNKRGIGCADLIIKKGRQVDIWQRPKGFRIRQDSGWRMPLDFKEHGYKGVVLNKVSEPRSIIKEVGQMWELNGEPIICHMGKSTKRRQGRISRWQRSINNYLNEKKST